MTMTAEDKERLLKLLEDAINEIYRDPETRNFNDVDLYEKACNLIEQDCEDALHSFVDNTVSRQLKTVSEAIKASQDGEFLKELNLRYRDHNRAVERLGNILILMDMDYAEEGKGTLRTTVHDIGHCLWREYVIDNTEILTRTVNTLLDLIHRERTGERDVSIDLTFPPDDTGPSFEVYCTPWHPALRHPAISGPSDASLPPPSDHDKAMAALTLKDHRPNESLVREYISAVSATRPATILPFDHGLMRSTVMMLRDTDYFIYREGFETPFLKAAAEYYAAESRKLLELGDRSEYLKNAERRLDEEVNRVFHYLDDATEAQITSIVVTEMVQRHMDKLVFMENSWLKDMLTDDKYDDLSRIYNLLSRVPNGLRPIRTAVALHAEKAARTELLPLAEGKKKYKPNQLSLSVSTKKDKYVNIIKRAFRDNPEFHEDLNSVFRRFEQVLFTVRSW